MSLSLLLLAVSLCALAYLSVYALALLLVAFGPGRRPAVSASFGDRGAVEVLIPAHQEGPAVVDAVETVLRQDYQGPITVHVLLAGATDASVQPLLVRYPPGQPIGAGRTVRISYPGGTAKRDKLAAAIPGVAAPFTAILDADHRAAPDWISRALSRMEAEGTRACQSRRRPLAIGRLAQWWDSLQNHLGNERVNALLARLLGTVFFTGTTAVFRTELLRRHPISDCITEDTWLAYDLLLAGERISHDDRSGSFEEVAPDFASYVSRRRRWSAGHTHCFGGHLRAILRAPLPLRMLLWVHGQFFLAPIAAVALFTAHGLHAWLQLALEARMVVVLFAALLAVALASATAGRDRRFASNFLTALVLALPQVSALGSLVYLLEGSEAYHYVAPFPYAHELAPLYLILLAAPLIAAAAAAWRLDRRRLPALLLLLWTYPVFLVLDVYACTLGLVDLLLGRARWTPVPRDLSISPEALAGVRGGLAAARPARSRLAPYALIPATLAAVAMANELLAVDNCGELRPLLWRPLLRERVAGGGLSLDLQQTLDGNTVEVTARASFPEAPAWPLHAEFLLDGAPLAAEGVEATVRFPAGWAAHRIDLLVTGPGLRCDRARRFSTAVKELRGRSLWINGEPFLIKGMIPSFGRAHPELGLDQGLAQIKEAGANAVRLYHAATPGMRAALASRELLLVDQPDRSTWHDVDLASSFDRKRLADRYRDMAEADEGFPYLLFQNLGNELELGSSNSIPQVLTLMREMEHQRAWPSAYATYSTFVPFPVEILGVNMLDSGGTYWNGGLALIQALKKPFYASELGGFVAFHERIGTWRRVTRLAEQWARLVDQGALGAFVYQSHDNWGQPVVRGYNDPFTPEQPDDLRGFWDRENQPKVELPFLRQLFADVTVAVREEVLAPDAAAATLAVRNRRPYRLRGVRLTAPASAPLGDLAPGEETRLLLPLAAAPAAAVGLRFEYQTHTGLAGVSWSELSLPRIGAEPVVLNPDAVLEETSRNAARGILLASSAAEVVLPADWSSFRFNGVRMSRVADRLLLPVAPPRRPVERLEVLRPGRGWVPFEDGLGGGKHAFRFRLPARTPRGAALVFAGLGAQSLTLAVEGMREQRVIPAHSYREVLVDLAQFPADLSGRMMAAEVDRREIRYVSAAASPLHEDVWIEIERPWLFAPAEFEIVRE